MTIEGQNELEKVLGLLPGRIVKEAKKIIHLNARVLQRYLREERMTGGTSASKLHVRTGRLRGSVMVLPETETATGVEGGVGIGTRYGKVHVGPRMSHLIRPKKGKFLAIPLEAALTPAGVAKGPPRSSIWGETFIAKSKKGSLIVWGQQRIMKGKRGGQLRGNILPLFLLVKQVNVPTRIHPDEIIDYIRPKIIEDFSSGRFKVAK